jgi:hypothetical protein
MRVTSGSWDGEKVFLKDQVLKVCTRTPTPGSASLAKPRRRTWDPPYESYDRYGPGGVASDEFIDD